MSASLSPSCHRNKQEWPGNCRYCQGDGIWDVGCIFFPNLFVLLLDKKHLPPAGNTQFFCGLSGRQSDHCSQADNKPGWIKHFRSAPIFVVMEDHWPFYGGFCYLLTFQSLGRSGDLFILPILQHTHQSILTSLMSSAAPAEALVCDQCGATFSSEEALEAHRLTHTGNTHAIEPKQRPRT